MYGVEAWPSEQNTIKSIERSEMWGYRRILKIHWIDKVSDVLGEMKKRAEILTTIIS